MSNDHLNGPSLVLRLEFSIEDAVQQRGLVSVLITAIAAWWNLPRLAPDLPARLREDMGLPPDTKPSYWPEPSANPQVPSPVWRPGM